MAQGWREHTVPLSAGLSGSGPRWIVAGSGVADQPQPGRSALENQLSIAVVLSSTDVKAIRADDDEGRQGQP